MPSGRKSSASEPFSLVPSRVLFFLFPPMKRLRNDTPFLKQGQKLYCGYTPPLNVTQQVKCFEDNTIGYTIRSNTTIMPSRLNSRHYSYTSGTI
jgi:hypothetical protein